jgi:hypothetical protein
MIGGVGPPSVAACPHLGAQHLDDIEPGNQQPGLSASIGPARLNAAAVVEDRVVEVDQDAAGR